MKRKIACVAFWCLLYIDLFVLSTVLGAFFTVSSDVDSGSIIVLLIISGLLAGGTILLYRLYDPFRERYSVANETPLLYHKLLCYIGLPIGILMTIASIFNTFTAEDFSSNSLYWIDLFFLFSSLIASCVCFAGLKKLRPYAWYARIVGILLDTLYALAVVVCRIIIAPFFLSSSLVSLMVTVYVSAIIALYYYKRKNLFFVPQLEGANVALATTNVAAEGTEKIVLDETVKFSLSPVDTNTKETASGGWRVPASDLALDRSVQEAIPHTTRTDRPISDTPPAPSAPTTKKKFCSRCGSEIDASTKKCTGCGKQYFKGLSRNTVVSIVVVALLAISCTLNILQYIDISARNAEMSAVHSELRDKIKENSDLRDDLSETKDKLFDYREKAEFLDEYIVFVEDDGTKLYHKYECSKFKANAFWAYTDVGAKSLGFRPCSLCH